MKKIKIVYKKLAETEDKEGRIKEGDVAHIVDFISFAGVPTAVTIIKRTKTIVLPRMGDFHERADIKSY